MSLSVTILTESQCIFNGVKTILTERYYMMDLQIWSAILLF